MIYERPIHKILPYEIRYHTKDAAGRWEHTRLKQGYWSMSERDAELDRLQEDVEKRHLTHIEYWAATNEFELDQQFKAKERSGYESNAVI